jgi:hypothetical protein
MGLDKLKMRLEKGNNCGLRSADGVNFILSREYLTILSDN